MLAQTASPLRAVAVSSVTLVAALLVALPAHPQAQPAGQDPCLSAPIDGQQQQRAGKLMQARASYLACSKRTCPKVIVQDCEHWLREVEDALPSVILAARDTAGHDLLDARVSVDGAPAAPVTALGIPLDPGQHVFVFQRDGSPPVQEVALLRAGEKNREITGIFKGPGMKPVLTERPIPLSAWVAAGVGVASFAVFGTFGALGVSQRSSDGCATGCTADQKSSVDTKFVVADVGLGLGVAALGAAVVLYLARPEVVVESGPAKPPSAFFDVRSVPGGGVGVLSGSF